MLESYVYKEHKYRVFEIYASKVSKIESPRKLSLKGVQIQSSFKFAPHSMTILPDE
jgi:hypothetical protein